MSRLHSNFQRHLVLYLHINQPKNSILKTIFRILFLYGFKNVQESLYNVADFNFVQIWILHHRFYQGFEAILEITKTDIAQPAFNEFEMFQILQNTLIPSSWSWSYTQKFSSANTIFWSFVLLFLCGARRIILFSSNIWWLDPWYTQTTRMLGYHQILVEREMVGPLDSTPHLVAVARGLFNRFEIFP